MGLKESEIENKRTSNRVNLSDSDDVRKSQDARHRTLLPAPAKTKLLVASRDSAG